MTLTDEGRRVAARPAFPTEVAVPPVGVPDPPHGIMPSYPAQPPRAFSTGMTIHELVAKDALMKYLSGYANPTDSMVSALAAADDYCNALGALEAVK